MTSRSATSSRPLDDLWVIGATLVFYFAFYSLAVHAIAEVLGAIGFISPKEIDSFGPLGGFRLGVASEDSWAPTVHLVNCMVMSVMVVIGWKWVCDRTAVKVKDPCAELTGYKKLLCESSYRFAALARLSCHRARETSTFMATVCALGALILIYTGGEPICVQCHW